MPQTNINKTQFQDRRNIHQLFISISHVIWARNVKFPNKILLWYKEGKIAMKILFKETYRLR